MIETAHADCADCLAMSEKARDFGRVLGSSDARVSDGGHWSRVRPAPDGAGLWAELSIGIKMNLGARESWYNGDVLGFRIGDGRRRLFVRMTSSPNGREGCTRVELFRLKRGTDEEIPLETVQVRNPEVGEWLIRAHDRAVR